MPSKFSWSKSNRSHSSVDTSSGHPSPVPSVNNDAAAHQHQQQQAHQSQQAQHPQAQQQPLPLQTSQPSAQQQIPQAAPQGGFRQQFPHRTTSHRHSAHLSLDQSPQNPQTAQPQTSPGVDHHRRGSYQPQQGAYAHQEAPKKSLRSRIAAGLSGHKEDEGRHSNKNGIGRRVSVRKSDGAPDGYQSPANDRLQAQQPWSQRQGSSSHLPTSNEQDEDNLDPFLQQEDHNTPAPPPKDHQYQQPPPQFVTSAHDSQQYNRPPLARVDTQSSGSYHTQGGVDHYSPEQRQGLQQQPQQPQNAQQQQVYQSYQPPVQHAQNPGEYQAFQPQTAPSPHLGTAQLHSQDLAQQQNYYPYQQQQQSGQQSQQQSPQDLQQQAVHYQQQQFSPPSQPHQGQDPQYARPPSQQQQHDTQSPQAPHQPIPQIIQQGQQVDTEYIQQLRPPSQQQQLAPPSPLQQQQPPQYQAYDTQQQGQATQTSEAQTQSTTPPQQGQDNMAPPSQPRNTLRKVNDAAGPPPGAPSRESSLLQQPPSQGQPGQPPVSPGLPTFGANVVPPASQGQPYRGDKGGQPGSVSTMSDMGRATPPPRNAADMSDEEIHQLIKEHEVLREKYQKVKRYFFEQQSQVHQLQNTLAHQRLSLSRTSWDDSEYATRFNRLDGLIAQMSFAIRKDWKSIPPWMQTVVNKNAVETGKQEMTAVGRAFISSWLVENIFDKYFHPDLDAQLSTQLKTVQLNIRRFSPTCQSSEDEDALIAKVINWRLATLEGLAELLRAPNSAQNRHDLIETLNESLIGSLQMYLNDPAPPDLNGGVPMIIELAVSVAQHLPLESREVHIEYFKPGHGLVSEHMKMESGIPALTNPILDSEDAASVRSVASKIDDASSIVEQEQQTQQNQQQGSQAPKEVQDKKRGMFGFGGGKKATQTPAQLGKRESSLGQGESQQSLTQAPPGSSSGPKDEPPPPRVRLAVGVAVQIRGKSVLFKAPVYST